MHAIHKFIAPQWSISCNYVTSVLGRVWILWNPQKISLIFAVEHSQVINCYIELIDLKKRILASFVYAANTAVERRALWRALNSHCLSNEPWIVMGDFNVLLHVNDSFGGALRWIAGMHEFRECLEKNGLEDLRYSGVFHTWSNGCYGCANISRKLDRVLVNYSWMALFTQAECEFMPHGISDYSPMVVRFGNLTLKRNVPFRFFNFWTLHPAFVLIVSYEWQREFHGSKMFILAQKLRAIKKTLKQLNKSAYSDISARVAACRVELSLCQRSLDMFPLDDSLKLNEKELACKFTELSLAEEMFFKQKAQVHWLKEGDQNTAFFMRSFSSKANRRKLMSITDSNGLQLNGEDMQLEFLNHFKSILGQSYQQYTGMSSFAHLISKKVPNHCIPDLTSIPSDLEIQSAILSFHPFKSPGPDGFNSSSSLMLGLSLVPNPSVVSDFRPISCCNLIYKAISKLIAMKLSPIFLTLISPCQNAFVKGRHISDNVILAHELLNAFVNWISQCITTPTYTISLNSELFGFFKGKRGIRQGDSISPLLFVLATEVLTLTINHKVRSNPYFKFHWRCKKLSITHLIFANDILVFSYANLDSVQTILEAFKLFCSFSGLQMNPSKCKAYLSNVDSQSKANILALLQFDVGSLPTTYLGLPLSATAIKARDCQTMVERITRRVGSWTSKFLSYVGRAVLIKSVLVAIQSYWSQVFSLPKKVLDDINHILRSFYWSGTDLKKSGAKVAWATVCRPKMHGGLGFPDLKMSNRFWKLCQRKENLWVA
ncbi:uncharacterized protein LOC132281844 [Cornus florida]|uniref:uncharacterized protein LOC132281844 n=1 Tax=Cornus florida TaxID=4283 RepID=UPI002897F92B|nr:uncharacterized protein LOC132281844 [Cornus florida]